MVIRPCFACIPVENEKLLFCAIALRTKCLQEWLVAAIIATSRLPCRRDRLPWFLNSATFLHFDRESRVRFNSTVCAFRGDLLAAQSGSISMRRWAQAAACLGL
jgi:hypothetical protein